MNGAHDILHAFAALGANVEPRGARLVVRAGARPVPGALLERARVVKPDLLRLLQAEAQQSSFGATIDAAVPLPVLDAAALKDCYEERLAIIVIDGGEDRDRAEAMAWNAVAAVWHREHGSRIGENICAGCGAPIGDGEEVILLPHGDSAHAGHGSTCIVAYARRWKAEAVRALAAIGLPTPRSVLTEIAPDEPQDRAASPC